MNALELEPLITPAAVSWWPLAAGWWLLAALLLSVVLLLKFRPWKRLQRGKRGDLTQHEQPLDPQRQIALLELAQLDKPYNGQPASGCSNSMRCSNACVGYAIRTIIHIR